jgi:hypothetical protein
MADAVHTQGHRDHQTLRRRLAQKDQPHHPDIEERRDRRGDHTHDRQPTRTALNTANSPTSRTSAGIPRSEVRPVEASLSLLGTSASTRWKLRPLRTSMSSLRARPARPPGPVELTHSDPAGVCVRGRLGRKKHRRTRQVGPACCERTPDSDRDPPAPAQMAAHSVAGHNRPCAGGC